MYWWALKEQCWDYKGKHLKTSIRPLELEKDAKKNPILHIKLFLPQSYRRVVRLR